MIKFIPKQYNNTASEYNGRYYAYPVIEETLDRDSLRLAQTPQVFKTELYRAAAYVAKEEGFCATDDNMLAEHIGYPVKYVDCQSGNIKLTTPDDLTVAEVLLKKSAAAEN